MGKVDTKAPDLSKFKLPKRQVPDHENYAVLLREFEKPDLNETDYELLKNVIDGSSSDHQSWSDFQNRQSAVFQSIKNILSRSKYKPEQAKFNTIPREIENSKILILVEMEIGRIKLLENKNAKIKELIQLLSFGLEMVKHSFSPAESFFGAHSVSLAYDELVQTIVKINNPELIKNINKAQLNFDAIEQTKKETIRALLEFCDFISNHSAKEILLAFEMDEGWLTWSYLHDYFLHKNRTKELLINYQNEFSTIIETTPSCKEFISIQDIHIKDFIDKAKQGNKVNYAGGMILLQYSWTFNSFIQNSLIENKLNHLIILASKLKYELKYKTKLKSLDLLIPEFLTEIPYDNYTGRPVSYNSKDEHIEIYIKKNL